MTKRRVAGGGRKFNPVEKTTSRNVTLSDKALEEAKHQEQAQILAELRRRRFTPPSSAPDSVEMLREDRQR